MPRGQPVSFMNFRTSPAVVTPLAAQRLPRLALVLLAALYILPGLLGREPWKPYDGANLGLMIHMADGSANWLYPSIAGLPMSEGGWLPYWIGALFIWALPFVDPAMASRIPLGLSLAATFVATWYATYHLARAPGAQPVPFAFGGQASTKAYACAMADASLLALIACLGLAHMGHEFSLHPFATAFVAILFWAFAKVSVIPTAHNLQATWIVAAGALLGLMASGYPATATLLIFVTLMGLLQRENAALQVRSVKQAAIGVFVVAVFLYTLVPWPRDGLVQWTEVHHHVVRALKTMVWFGWPAWPLAAWAIWRWRLQRRSPHIWLPGFWLGVLFVVGVTAGVPQRHLMLTLPILASLAVFALPTFKRSALALIDWVALLLFTTVGFVIWFYWFAFQTGAPAPAANAVARLLPGFEPAISWIECAFAAAITVAWAWMIRWRTGHQQHALWKGLVLSASGTIWVWGLLMSLWLPAVNYGMSYDMVARRIGQVIPASKCISATGLAPTLFAALERQGLSIVLNESLGSDAPQCDHWVMGEDADMPRFNLAAWTPVTTVWQLDRRGNGIRVFQRLATPDAAVPSKP